MSYSSESDVLNILPDASGLVPNNLAFTDWYTSLATDMSRIIDNQIEDRTVTPSSEAVLSRIEALYIAGEMLRTGKAARNQDVDTLEQIQGYEDRADKVLERTTFPGTVSAGDALSTNVGNGTCAITIDPDYIYTARWEVRCTSAASKFEVTNNVKGLVGSYDVASDDQFPDLDQRKGNAYYDLVRSVNITITAGATAFAQGDAFRFRTYSPYRKERKQAVRTLNLQI